MNGSEMLREGLEPEVPQSTPAQPDKPETKNAPDPAVKALEKSLAQLQQSLNEERQNARFWHERATTAPKPEAPKPETKAVDPAEFVELLTSKGPAAVEELIEKKLREGGFVSKSEVEATIAAVRGQVTIEQQLERDYPDLADPTSDMFKETARQYQELVAGAPELKGKPIAMRTAAKLAEAALDLDPAEKPRRATSRREDVQDAEDVDTDAETREAERVRRVRSQGTPSRRARRDDTDDNELSPIQKSIVENLRNAGANITEEKLRKRIEGGTALSGRVGLAVAAMESGRRGRR